MKLQTPFWIDKSVGYNQDKNLWNIREAVGPKHGNLSQFQTYVYSKEQEKDLNEILKRINHWDEAIELLNDGADEYKELRIFLEKICELKERTE